MACVSSSHLMSSCELQLPRNFLVMMPTSLPNLVTIISLDPICRKMLCILGDGVAPLSLRLPFVASHSTRHPRSSTEAPPQKKEKESIRSFEPKRKNKQNQFQLQWVPPGWSTTCTLRSPLSTSPASPVPGCCDAGVSGTTSSTDVSMRAEASTHPAAPLNDTMESARHPWGTRGTTG